MELKRFLIVKTSSLGDVLQAMPVVEYLKERYPGAQVDWLVEASYADLVQSYRQVDRCLTVNTRKWTRSRAVMQSLGELRRSIRELRRQEYDAALDIQGNCKSAFFLSFVKAQTKVGFGRKTVFEWPNLLATNLKVDPPRIGRNVREEYLSVARRLSHDDAPFSIPPIRLEVSQEARSEVDALLRDRGSQPKLLVAPGAFWPNKKLSMAAMEAFLANIRRHTDFCYLFLWGSDFERLEVEQIGQGGIVLPHKLSLPALYHLISRVQCVLSMDSLPLHLAGLTKTPTFSVFGPSSRSKFQPLKAAAGGFQGSCPYGISFERRCPRLRTCKTGNCLKAVGGDELARHFLGWWLSEGGLEMAHKLQDPVVL